MTDLELYHVGIVVSDLDAAIVRLGKSLKLEWSQVFSMKVAVRDVTGPEEVTLRLAISRTKPFLELIEEVPGSVWITNEHSNLHHLGYWTDSLETSSTDLSASGCPLEIAGLGRGGAVPAAFAYHLDPLGIRLELSDRSAPTA